MDNITRILLLYLSFTIILGPENVRCQQVTLRDLTSLFGAEYCIRISDTEESNIISNISLRFYFDSTIEVYETVPLNMSTVLLDHPKFNRSTCMVVYMFGWTQSAAQTSGGRVMQAYLDNGSYNVILVDWGSVSQNNYLKSVALTPPASEAIAKALDDLIDAGAELCHISGHSLGGQATGHIARNMRNRVRHIIAIDPAGPLFYQPLLCVPPLSADDADCVEVIHTDRGQLGAPGRTGTVDYWMNGGARPQPGCAAIGCSHPRSVFYWIEAVRNSTEYVGRQCGSYLSFLLNRCSNNDVSIIGQCDNNTAPGSYYLRTSGTTPFGLGLDGASPSFILG